MQRLITGLLLTGLWTAAVPLLAQSSNDYPVAPPQTNDSQTQLPDAPDFAARLASVSGTVLDPSGAAVQDAPVTLTHIDESQGQSTTTGTDGRFSFSGVHPGSYTVMVQAKGFEPATTARFTVTAAQSYEIPKVKLSLAAITTKVVVEPTEVIAAQQIKAQEKQRVLAVIPDFYTSYVWNAAPLNTKQKFSLSIRHTFDPTLFVGVSLTAGIQQARNDFSGYGQGAQGYAKRWSAQFANGRTSDILSTAVFPALFHQDPRYFYQGSGSVWSRAKHAVGYAFVARSDSGHPMPNYSYFFGDLSAGALSNLYYPSSNRGVGLVFTNAGIGVAGRAGQALIREFVFKHLTKNVPDNGKPASSDRGP